MQSIYERIELLIKRQGITKKSFCAQLGISTGNMGDWKRGKSTPGTHKLIEIAAFFHVSLDWLILQAAPNDSGKRRGLFFGQMRQLNCQTEELLPEERTLLRNIWPSRSTARIRMQAAKNLKPAPLLLSATDL